MQIITLTTDFGTKDWFTGAVKGTILSISKNSTVVDISHDLENFNIKEASFFLKNFYATFPKKTIHCIVVDPTVGSDRKILAIETENYYFIAPDNGVLTDVISDEEIINIVEIKQAKDTSSTFHGRDIFAPAAANLANSQDIKTIGSAYKDELVKFTRPTPSTSENTVEGEIIYIDKFGNIILNITNKMWNFFTKNEYNDFFNLHIGGKKYILRHVKTYSNSLQGEFLLIKGSCGYMEIALNLKSAADNLKTKNGTQIKIEKTGNK